MIAYIAPQFPVLIRDRIPFDIVGHGMRKFGLFNGTNRDFGHYHGSTVQQIQNIGIVCALFFDVGHVIGEEFAVTAAVGFACLTLNLSFYMVVDFGTQINAYIGIRTFIEEINGGFFEVQ